ncbi:TetR/AcrR family transcriptional regulator [Amycolatopsis suaedae]|uniref:TetR/AcrR family transcriptional regulator n=1 Tax=Amycolatopsis suaedae TaxID=2510978 RepID=A0A4Q7J1V7_9PSEU|nr:TetR/AcrR family transcriptional regulator [Amycolatopsis suaedae]RZQ61400.1 TetR/AcrR family transcriptional regulator [Amycolatopsis suaedae]
MGALRTPREKWVEAGLRALAGGGVDAVRVEALAKSLGVTKGGFYGYFADRDALLLAMLDTWEQRSIGDVLDRVERETRDPRKRVRLAGQLTYSEELIPIDLAVRDWARRDEVAAGYLRRVDNERMRLLRDMIGTFCDDPDEVEARSLLAFCLAIGHHFLATDHGGRSRVDVRARAGDIILDQARPGGATTAQ